VARVADADGHDLDHARLVGGEVGADLVLHLPAGDGGGQDPVVRKAELDAQERQAQQDQQGDHRPADHDRAAHDGQGHAVPEPLAHVLGRRPTHRPGVDAGAEGGQGGGEHDHRHQGGQGHHGNAAVGERAQEREREHQQRAE